MNVQKKKRSYRKEPRFKAGKSLSVVQTAPMVLMAGEEEDEKGRS